MMSVNFSHTRAIPHETPKVSDDEHVDEPMHRHGLEPGMVPTQSQDALATLGGEARRQVAAKLLFQDGDAFAPAAAMADGVFDFDALRGSAIAEEDLDGIGDGASVGSQIVLGIAGLL